MLTLNFQSQFVKAVENGLAQLRGDPLPWPGVRPKRQTIRAYRKDGKDPKPGDWRALYTGMRTKKCRKLGEVRCKSIHEIELDWGSFAQGLSLGTVLGSPYPPDRLARRDGFNGFVEMLNWFERTHRLPFGGLLIQW